MTLVFISHRHGDALIAQVVRKHLNLWGIANNVIFQSSEPGLGARPGERLTDEIKAALYQSKLVLLLYTRTDEDWSYCMFECGLATDPQKPEQTRIIVLQCNDFESVPRMFEGDVVVRIDKKDIRNFTERLLKEDDFIPGEPARYPDASLETLADLSNRFYEELRDVIFPGRIGERFRWDRFTLKLDDVPAYPKDASDEDALCKAIIQSDLVVTHAFGGALMHFGFTDLEGGMRLDGSLTLNDLIERWTRDTQDKKPPRDWVKGLALEIYRAIEARPADPTWRPLASAHYRNLYYYVVLNHHRVFPDRSMEFDIYLYDVQGVDAQ